MKSMCSGGALGGKRFAAFGINDDRNGSLPGREQTNNRAELLAVIALMQVHDWNLEIRSDSEYVVRVATSRTRGETQKCNEENADLWNEFETLLRLNDMRRLEFVLVKRHATKAHTDRLAHLCARSSSARRFCVDSS